MKLAQNFIQSLYLFYKFPFKLNLYNKFSNKFFLKNFKISSKTTIFNLKNDIASAIQFSSNDPCEDKFTLKYFNDNNQNNNKNNNNNNKILFFSIFDGHGGSLLSEYANNYTNNFFSTIFNSKYFNFNYNNNNFEKSIVYLLKYALKNIEKNYYSISYEKYLNKKGREAAIGTCALIGLLFSNKLFVANLGDSKGRMFSYNNNNYFVTKLNDVHNARKIKEKNYLENKFFFDKNIIVCKNKKTCYVKGRLQCTRSLGDYYLKFKEFNMHVQTKENKNYYKKEIKNFKGPYIKNEPEIKIFDINNNINNNDNSNYNDKYIIFGSDGLWDYLKSREIGKKIKEIENENINNISQKINNKLIEIILNKASIQNNIKIRDLLNLSKGKILRKILDDTTIITINLTNFYKF